MFNTSWHAEHQQHFHQTVTYCLDMRRRICAWRPSLPWKGVRGHSLVALRTLLLRYHCCCPAAAAAAGTPKWETVKFADGGATDNLGITGLLRRGVKSMIVCSASSAPPDDTWKRYAAGAGAWAPVACMCGRQLNTRLCTVCSTCMVLLLVAVKIGSLQVLPAGHLWDA